MRTKADCDIGSKRGESQKTTGKQGRKQENEMRAVRQDSQNHDVPSIPYLAW